MKKLTLIFALVLTAASTFGQVSQKSNTLGLNAAIGGHVLGWTSAYFKYMDENAPSGYGGGIRLGYGITQLIEPYIGFDATSMDVSKVDAQSFKMTHVDFGVRFNLGGTILPVRPFVEGGYTSRTGTIQHVINGSRYDDLKFSGGTPHLGGGLNYFFNKGISVYARGIFTIGKTSDLSLNGTKQPEKADVTTFRIGVGISVNVTELINK
jgi:hypothetical protein